MYLFNSDYMEGANPKILERLSETNLEQTVGYGEDPYCLEAAKKIKERCNAPEAMVHFLVGGTQTNMTVIDAILMSYQGVISADSGHINVHETGAVEATGHKVLALPNENGKLTAKMVEDVMKNHLADESREHTVYPKMVYISNPTEYGTLYSLKELEALSEICKEYGLYLFMDGARLAYGLMSPENDMKLEDIAKLCDIFYIGGTKVGALFGEAVVITNKNCMENFRYSIKQHGGMLAKGRLLGIQFLTLFEDDLYFEMGKHAIDQAMKLKEGCKKLGLQFFMDSPTNQQFLILPEESIAKLRDSYGFTYQGKYDENHGIVRFCTSWATKPEAVDSLLKDLEGV